MAKKDSKHKLHLVALVICFFVFILITFLFSAFLGSVITSSKCTETDRGLNTYVQGEVSLCVNENCTVEAEDYCDAEYIVEYYCTNFGNIASRLSKCTFGCYKGECLHISETPASKEAQKAKEAAKAAAEAEEASAESAEETPEISEEEKEEIQEMVCDEGWLCEENIRGFQGADCAWIKEEFCKYGCAAGECEMPGWWGKFVFWLRNPLSG